MVDGKIVPGGINGTRSLLKLKVLQIVLFRVFFTDYVMVRYQISLALNMHHKSRSNIQVSRSISFSYLQADLRILINKIVCRLAK